MEKGRFCLETPAESSTHPVRTWRMDSVSISQTGCYGTAALMFHESKSGKDCPPQPCHGAPRCPSDTEGPDQSHYEEPLSGTCSKYWARRPTLLQTESAGSCRPLSSWPRASASSQHKAADGLGVLPLCCFSRHSQRLAPFPPRRRSWAWRSPLCGKDWDALQETGATVCGSP